jgi:hypothetical protein
MIKNVLYERNRKLEQEVLVKEKESNKIKINVEILL